MLSFTLKMIREAGKKETGFSRKLTLAKHDNIVKYFWTAKSLSGTYSLIKKKIIHCLHISASGNVYYIRL